MSENGEIYTAGNKFYTPAGTDGMDKFHLCLQAEEVQAKPQSKHLRGLAEPYSVLRYWDISEKRLFVLVSAKVRHTFNHIVMGKG